MPFLHPALCRRRITDLTVDELRTVAGYRCGFCCSMWITPCPVMGKRNRPRGSESGCTGWNRRVFRLLILSNNTKKRVAPFAAKLGLPFLSCCAKTTAAVLSVGVPPDGCKTAGSRPHWGPNFYRRAGGLCLPYGDRSVGAYRRRDGLVLPASPQMGKTISPAVSYAGSSSQMRKDDNL